MRNCEDPPLRLKRDRHMNRDRVAKTDTTSGPQRCAPADAGRFQKGNFSVRMPVDRRGSRQDADDTKRRA